MHPASLIFGMSSALFADAPSRFAELWPLLLPAALGFLAVYLLLPRAHAYPGLWGSLSAALTLLSGGWLLTRARVASPETVLFYAFSLVAIVSGGLLVTQRNPVRAALSFALVVLSTCGLFLLLAAPFLMAATVIVYAGAIVVTFLFVIMLAQQEGQSDADHRSREPGLSCVSGFLLLGALLYLLHLTYDTGPLDSFLGRVDAASAQIDPLLDRSRSDNPPSRDDVKAALDRAGVGDIVQEFVRYPSLGEAQDDVKRPWRDLETELSITPNQAKGLGKETRDSLAELRNALAGLRQAGDRVRGAAGSLSPDPRLPLSDFSGPAPNQPRRPLPADNVAALGRSLFTDYLIPVELGGTLLLVATVGAIAVTGRRSEGLR